MLHKGILICYYSDQRDPQHGQTIVHQASIDGLTWGKVVTDFSSPAHEHRPGMPVVARMGNGLWIMSEASRII